MQKAPSTEAPLPTARETRHWFAAYTAANHEKRVGQYLQAKGIEYFLPLHSLTRRWKNRTTVKVELPLFAGYIFVRISTHQRVRVVEVPMVYSIVSSKSEPVSIPDDEIERIRTILKEREAHPYPYVKVGHRVRVRSGPLAGLEGTVVRTYGGLSVVLNVELIQKSIAVHVEADELESSATESMLAL